MATSSIPITSAKELGKAIRAARLAMGLQQVEAALLCGVGVRFLSDLERGKDTARISTTLKVISGLGLMLSVGQKKPFWKQDA